MCPPQRIGRPRRLRHESSPLWQTRTSHGAYCRRSRSASAPSALPYHAAVCGGVSLRRDLPHAARPLRHGNVGGSVITALAVKLPNTCSKCADFGGNYRPRQAAPFRIVALPIVRASPRLGIAGELHVPQRGNQQVWRTEWAHCLSYSQYKPGAGRRRSLCRSRWH